MKRTEAIIYFLLFASSVHYALISPQQGPIVFGAFLVSWAVFLTWLLAYRTERSAHYLAAASALTFAGLIRLFYKQFPGVLVGPSYQPSYRTLNTVVDIGSVTPEQSMAAADAQYPGSYIIGAAISNVADVSVFATVQWLPGFITLAFLAFVFLAGRQLFGVRPAALAVVVLSVFPRYVFTHSAFIKETAGIVLVSVLLYLLILKFDDRAGVSRTQLSLVGIVSIAALTVSHHLSAAIGLTLLVILIGVHHLPLSNHRITRIRKHYLFFTLATLIAVSFWIHVEQSPLVLVVTELLTALGPTSATTSQAIRISGTAGAAFFHPYKAFWSIAWNISFILGPIAGIAGLLTTIFIPEKRTLSFGLIIFGGLMALFTLILTVFSSASSSGAAWGGRFVVYGLATLYLAGAAIAFDVPKYPGVKPLGAILLIAVLVVQGFATPPSLYMNTAEPIDVDPHPYYSQPSEKASVDWTVRHTESPDRVTVDIWLYQRTASLYDYSTQDRIRRLRQCGSRGFEYAVTSTNALPNSPACLYPRRGTIYDSGSAKTHRR